MVGSFLETGNTGKGRDEEMAETTGRVILKERSLKCLADTPKYLITLEELGLRGDVAAGDVNPTGGELSRVDVECFAPCLAPRRASKEGSPFLLTLRVRTSRSPEEGVLVGREVTCLGLGVHCLSTPRDKQPRCLGVTGRTTRCWERLS